MSNRTGRLLVVDIGSEETKLLDVTVSSGLILHNIERMRDMSPFIGDGKLINFEQFVLSLKDTLKSKGIRTKRVLLTSSVLGIESEILKLPSGTEKDIDAAFKAKVASVKPELNRVDYQVYSTYTTESESNVHCVQATSLNYTINSLIKLLEAAGFTVVDVIDPMSALLNLSKLYPSSYDIQSRLFMSLGHTTLEIPIVRDAPMESKVPKFSFYSIIEALRQNCELPELKLRRILNVVGVKRDATLQKELIDADIDMDTYYGIIEECITDFKAKLAGSMKMYNSLSRYGIFSVLLTGGFVDMPGLLEELQKDSMVTFETVPDSMSRYSNIPIKNKTHENYSSAYDVCLGAALSKFFKRNISLRPKHSSAKVSTEVAEKACILATVAICAFTAFSGFNLYQNYVELDRLEGLKQETMKMQSQYSSSQRTLTEQKAYLEALKNVDSLMQPLVSYVKDSETATFRVASIDSKNLLIGAQLNQTGSMEFMDETSTPAETTEPVAEDGFITDATVAPETKSPIIIRGYALTTEEVSSFYNGLMNLNFAREITMNGIRSVQLPSTESMYIFEIQIER